MLGPKPVQLVGFRGGEIFRVPQYQPRRGAGRERLSMWIGHRRQAAARPDSALLSLAQTLGVARQRRITAAVALDLMEQAAIVPTAGVPALQNDRLPAIEPAPAGITALPALGKCLVPQVTDDGTARETKMAGDGLAGPADPMQDPNLLEFRQPPLPTLVGFGPLRGLPM